MTSERTYKGLIDDAILGELSPAKWALLRAHLGTCDDCRQRYDRVARVERFLDGNKVVSDAELARTGAAVFAALDAEAAPPVPALWGGWVALFAVAALALGVVLMPAGPRPDDVFRARGASTGAAPRAYMAAVCFNLAGPVVPMGAEGADTCALGSRLELALDNPGGYRHAFLVGVQSDRTPLWYSPRPPVLESPAAPAASEGPVVVAAARLAVNHRRGPLRVFALFSNRPIHAREVEAAIAKLPSLESKVLPLAAQDVLQRSMLIEVAP